MMSYVKKISARRSECFSDTMDDDSDDKDSKRKSRNLSEKKRRDQFNLLVSELGSMISSGGRKMDKSTVLKSTISFLKNHNETTMRSRVNEIQEDWKPTFLTNEEFTHLILEAVDGFIMVFSTSGQIFYVSENVTSLLGHLPDDIINMTLFELTSEEDHNNLYNILLRHNEDDGPTSFSCHVKRGAGPEPKLMVDYELVHFMGYFRLEEDLSHNENKYSYPQEEDGPRLVFYGTGKIHTPQLLREMALVDSTKSEFISRHSLEWKFLFLDHRAPPIIGYLPFELLGTSGYDYYHVDDLDKVIKCHDSLMKKGEGTSCYYRFLTKGQQWIWLQTRFYITYHQWNSKPEFVVCTHRVVSYLNVIKRNRKEEDVPELMNEPWTSTKTPKSVIRQRPSSDCTSMSADSPGSIQSLMTQYSVKSKATLSQKTAHSSSSNQAVPKQETSQQPQTLLVQPSMENFLEPPQYVAAIPISPVLTGFSPQAAVLSPIPRVDNLSQPQDQFHVDLQRKHAELQAMIGRQQAELRRVSEQLLMAKLGLLTTESEAVPHVSYTISAGTVSSTTSLPGFPGVPTVSSPQAMVPLAVPISLPMAMPHTQHHNLDVVFSPDSNTQNK